MTDSIFTPRRQRHRSWRTETLNPNEFLLKVMQATIPIDQSVVDLGAGNGTYVKALRDLGYAADGVDGTVGIEQITASLVRQVDLSKPCNELYGKWKWGIFIEVGEHVPVESEGILLDEVASIPSEGLIVSWAVPGQHGRGHVNCRDTLYVISVFAERGWKLDEDATTKARGLADRFFDKRLLVFQKGMR